MDTATEHDIVFNFRVMFVLSSRRSLFVTNFVVSALFVYVSAAWKKKKKIVIAEILGGYLLWFLPSDLWPLHCSVMSMLPLDIFFFLGKGQKIFMVYGFS